MADPTPLLPQPLPEVMDTHTDTLTLVLSIASAKGLVFPSLSKALQNESTHYHQRWVIFPQTLVLWNNPLIHCKDLLLQMV